MDIFRTPDSHFDNLPGYDFAPHYLDWNGIRVHHLDEGPADGPVMLLMHGEPTWSYLYRNWIKPLVAAGFRVIAPDHVGFGRSDKPTDDEFYVIERHCERIRHLIDTLDLRNITIVVQDWGGPTGLRQVCDMPERFNRVMILNTWLHHEGMAYSEGAQFWRQAALDPNILGGDMPVGAIVTGTMRREGHDLEAMAAGYEAPFDGLISKAGPRRFPYCIPFGDPIAGNAADQQRCYDALPNLGLPIHMGFGDDDPVFSWEWAEQWHAQLTGSTLERIAGAGHFVQEDAAADCIAFVLRHATPAA
jgi:haloalkane dehalogenase